MQAGKTIGPNQPQRAIFTKKGKSTERSIRPTEGQHLYEFRLEDFTLHAQVWIGETGLNRFIESLHANASSR